MIRKKNQDEQYNAVSEGFQTRKPLAIDNYSRRHVVTSKVLDVGLWRNVGYCCGVNLFLLSVYKSTNWSGMCRSRDRIEPENLLVLLILNRIITAWAHRTAVRIQFLFHRQPTTPASLTYAMKSYSWHGAPISKRRRHTWRHFGCWRLRPWLRTKRATSTPKPLVVSAPPGSQQVLVAVYTITGQDSLGPDAHVYRSAQSSFCTESLKQKYLT